MTGIKVRIHLLSFILVAILVCSSSQFCYSQIDWPDELIEETKTKKEKKVLTNNQIDWIKEEYVPESRNKYYGEDDIALTYNRFKELQLNYIKTSKKGKLPLVIFIPPGSFFKYNKDELLTMQMCREFASEGYNTASISYSLLTDLRKTDFGKTKIKNYPKYKIAEAIGDVSTAIKYLKDNHNNLNFDPNRIFIVGHSAGAIIALHNYFSTEEELKKYSNNYNSAYTRQKVRGVVAISGGLLDDHCDYSDTKNIPLLLFHGDEDETVPIGYEKTYKKVIKEKDIDLPVFKARIEGIIGEKQFSLEGPRIMYHIPKWVFKYTIGLALPQIIGSQNIFSCSQSKNVELEVIKGGKHVFMVNDNGILNSHYDKMKNKILTFLKENS